jgi:tRNA pseudouridine55 synthase
LFAKPEILERDCAEIRASAKGGVMGRRKKGRDVHGWLIVDKPSGISSAQVVAKLRWRLDARKAGHAGTLDPPATGLLAVAFGEATKTVPFAADTRKAYRFAVRWGAATSTDDAEGEPIATSRLRPSETEIRAMLPAFTGDILQIPPQVSAVKVGGERAYRLARGGKTLDLPPRPLHVERLDLVCCPDADTAILEMTCGKGGYVRSIGRDLGQSLGCLAHVAWLRRLWAGPFDLARALDWAETEREDADLGHRLLPLEVALGGLTCIECPLDLASGIRHGNPQPMNVCHDIGDGETVWARSGGRPLAVGRWSDGIFRPQRVFVFE